MVNMIKYEIQKLFSQKLIYICGIILIAIISVTAFAFSIDFEDESVYTNMYFLMTSLSGCSLDLMIPIVIATLVCSDFSNGTIKNIISRGYNRLTIYVGKYITSIIAVLILTLVCYVAALVTGTIFLENEKNWNMEIVPILVTQVILVIALVTISFAFTMMLKKASKTIAIGILMPTIISLVLSVVDGLLKASKINFSQYWIYNCYLEVSAISVTNEVLIQACCLSCIYIIVFLICGYAFFGKYEV